MRKQALLFLFTLGFLTLSLAQKKKITLEDIWGGTFRTEYMDVLRSMKNGKQYTVLNFDGSPRSSSLDKYDYATLEKVETVVSSSDEVPLFSSYTFSKDESKILLATEIEPIFRHSRLGVYYVYDVSSKKVTQVSDDKIQEPLLSPDGSQVAYVKENNIYIFDIDSGNTKQITTDGSKGTIINGVTDWVYEEEFAFVRAFDWNSNGTKIAFLRFDETDVPHFSMDVFGQNLYPFQYEFKYPKAGEVNAEVSLHMYDMASGSTSDVSLGDAYYIPRIKWRNNPDHLSVQTLNRHQNHLKLLSVNATNNSVSLLMEEKDAAYVDVTDYLTFLADDSFIWVSEMDGYNHIYLYGKDGKLKNQITQGEWEVTDYYGYDSKSKKIFYQSTENGSINRDVYSIGTNGKKKNRLTSKTGSNSAAFSTDYSYFINTFSSATTPYMFTLNKASNGETLKSIKDNAVLDNKLEEYELSPKEFSTISINGNDLNMYMVKPADFDENKKYPLLMFQYSGPGSQQVANRWFGANDYWHQMLASEGYIIACVDGRGTGYKGRDFKKVTYLNLVKYETEDQIAAAKKLSELPFIDEDRTGIWGWSYGGHMSTNCLLKGNDIFEMAIAVAPVTSWRFYDTIYTERFMRTPQENPEGYDNESPFNYPELLKGKYLLVHGSGDDNVHVQNSMRMIEALVQANKSFDWAIYPDKNHGIYGGNTRLHLFTKMTDFVKKNL
ncbi:S9 family peptidase [Flagellimonas sp. S3867]|uniref:S9 family peptidase n=1 Tax=Flagellimonas sp. S3867 TaxID=2768063 RepID=UPI0016864CB9|nr:S9 family peptidase [Flagellimonas sp. S3867]